MEHIGLIIAVAIVLVVVVLQVTSFIKTNGVIKELKQMFGDVEKISLKKTSITSDHLRSKESLEKFLNNIPSPIDEIGLDGIEKINYSNISLLYVDNKNNYRFNQVIKRTNEYLCKNIGTTADLGVLEDICDNQKNALEDEIHNSINVPLYLGLAGTFIGIVIGLSGVDFNSIFSLSTSDGSPSSLQHLMYGVIVAMCASFLGLTLTIYNSAVAYKKAENIVNEGKEDYIDFIRRELMPVLSNSLASSLSSLKSVLGHFVDNFGRNLDSYADSAELLNDNLEKQHLVLQEINNLSLTRTANKIAETFMQLKDASDSLEVFRTYQKELNKTTQDVGSVITDIKNVLEKFNSFADGLSIVVANQNKTVELQKEFKEAIATHFPIGSEARDAWRKEYDMFISEGAEVSKVLSAQLTASTEHIKKFVNENHDFFETFNKMQEVLNTMLRYTNVQAECYKDLKGEILNLRKDYKDAEKESVELHKATLEAVKTMTKAIKEMGK